MPRCQAITGYKARYQVEYHQQCQNRAAHIVDAVGLCATHFNAGFRKELKIVGELRLLDDRDIAGSDHGNTTHQQIC